VVPLLVVLLSVLLSLVVIVNVVDPVVVVVVDGVTVMERANCATPSQRVSCTCAAASNRKKYFSHNTIRFGVVLGINTAYEL
jgi:hypothetical protein